MRRVPINPTHVGMNRGKSALIVMSDINPTHVGMNRYRTSDGRTMGN